MIKTINLTADTEQEVNIKGSCKYCNIQNLSTDAVVYASKVSGVYAGADEVMAIDSKSSKIMSINDITLSDTIYLLSDKNCNVEIRTANDLDFFRCAERKAGGESYNDTVIKADIAKLQNNKVDKVTGKSLSSNDYTTAEKEKLAGLSVYDDAEIKREIQLLRQKIDGYYDTVVYGFHVTPNESNPSAAVTYLADAIGMTPAKMGDTAFDYGSWKSAFFMPKPCMVKYDGKVAYYLKPDDYTKKLDGTPSDIANPDFEGNAMMEWGQIWYKFSGGEEEGEGYFYVSNRQVDESYHCWCNYNSKDKIVPHFYTAIYDGTLHDGKFRSLSGFSLTAENGNGGTTCQQEITYCTANNTTSDIEWYTDVYADRILINALLVLIGKSLDTQDTFGRGIDTGGEEAKKAYVTGALNDKGLFYGVTASGSSGVKVFGMENWWGCAWRRTAGCVSVSNDYKVKLTYGTADGSTVNGYNDTGDGYISIGTTPSESGYLSKLKYDEYGYMPYEALGSSSTYYADRFSPSSGTRYMSAGGSVLNNKFSGAFYFILSYASTYASSATSTTLSYKPLMTQ